MEPLTAIGHIVGAILTDIVLGFVGTFLALWEGQRNEKRVLEETSIKFGVAVDDLNNEEFVPKLVQYSSERYSSELFKNRISDLCGVVRTLWGWLGGITQIAILIGVVWYTITESLGTAVYAWSIVAISLLFWIVSVGFVLLCRLLTGRYPGEAKQARKYVAEFLKNRRATQNSSSG